MNVSSATLRHVPTDLEEYFSQSLVAALSFDKDGSVWAATLRGIQNVTERSLLEVPGERATRVLTGSSIAQIVPLDRSPFLMTMRGDLYRLEDGKSRLVMKSPTIQAPLRPPFLIDEQSIGILTDHGVHNLELTNEHQDFDRVAKSTLYKGSFSSNAVRVSEFGVCAAKGSTLFCGLERLQGQQFELFSTRDDSEILYVEYWRDNHTVVTLSENQTIEVFQLRHSSLRTSIKLIELLASQVRCFYRWKQYALIGTDKGVLSVDLLDRSQKWIDTSVDFRTISFAPDVDGVWVLHEAGVSLLTESSIENWPHLRDSSGFEVLSVDGAKDSTLAGTFEGLYFVDFERTKPEKAWPASSSPSGLDQRITSLANDGRFVYAGTFSGELHILSLEERKVRLRSTEVLPSGITALVFNKNRLLIGTSQDGVYFLRDGVIEKLEMPTSWNANPTPITSIGSSWVQDTLVVTSENEVIGFCEQVDLSVCGVQLLDSSSKGSTLLTSTSNSKGSVFVGSLSGGLFETSYTEVRSGSPLRRRSVEGMPDSPIFSLDSAANGSLVIGTDDGVFVTNRELEVFRKYRRHHGLQNYNINHGASYFRDTETIFFGGRFGLSSFKIDTTQIEMTNTHTIQLRSATVPEAGRIEYDELEGVSQIALRYPNSSIALEFSVGDFRSILRNKYSFSLIGLDRSTHIKYGLGRAQYLQIPPGKYTFQARGADAHGVWSENELSIAIVVDAPWWRSKSMIWIYCVAGALFALLATHLFNARHKREQILAHAQEQVRALSRLELDWQEERGAAERVLDRITLSTLDILGMARVLLGAHLSAQEGKSAGVDALAIDGLIQALQKQQELCTRTTLTDDSNLYELVEELATAICAASPRANRYILLNDTPSVTVPSRHAQYLALIVHEVIRMLIDAPEVTPDPNPVIQLAVTIEESSSASGASYRVLASERLKHPIGDLELEEGLPVTFQLVEDLGGEVQQLHMLGLEIEVTVSLD